MIDMRCAFPCGRLSAVVGLIGALLIVCGPTIISRVRRWAGALAAVSLVSAVGASQFYLAEHWLSDVLGAVVLSSAVVLAAFAVVAARVHAVSRR